MSTDLDIWNRALLSVGARATVASAQEKSNEAAYCRLLYIPTRNTLMRAAHWNFTRATAYLTVLKAQPGTPENPSEGTPNWVPATQPPPGWLYSYGYPADCLLMRMIGCELGSGASSGVPITSAPSYVPRPDMRMRAQKFLVATDYDAQGNHINCILSNQQQAIGIYTRLIEQPGLWDAAFEEALVAALASRLCIPVNGDKTMGQQQLEYAKQAVMSARVSDGNEGYTVENWIPDWISVRGYAGDWSTGIYMNSWGSASFLGI